MRDFKNELYNRLARFEADAPDDLWSSIEQKLDESAREVPTNPAGNGARRARVVWLKRLTAVAASAALLAGLWQMMSTDQPVVQESSYAETAAPQPSDGAVQAQSDGETARVAPSFLAQTVAHPVRKTVASEPERFPKAGKEVSLLDKDGQENGPEMPSPKSETDADDSRQAGHSQPSRRQNPTSGHSVYSYQGKESRAERLTLTAYAANSFAEERAVHEVPMSMAYASKYGDVLRNGEEAVAAAKNSTIYLADAIERKKHYQPVSFGLSVGYGLNERLTLSSGVVYTKLRSDFTKTIDMNRVESRQTLHYVGIPLHLSCKIFTTGGLKAYVKAGGQTDINVRATAENDGRSRAASKDKLQFSADVSAGLQYDFLPELGVYAEPGVRYYFDNGSAVDNYFKDRPTAFSLQLGVRWNLK
ncbi:MAG: PorT family protein [Prevotella sp.]|nr:PorT family protein [Prevotella sp.]